MHDQINLCISPADGGTNWFGTFSNGQLTLEVEVDPVTRVPTERLFFDGVNKIPAFNDHLQKGISPGMLYYYDDVCAYLIFVQIFNEEFAK